MINGKTSNTNTGPVKAEPKFPVPPDAPGQISRSYNRGDLNKDWRETLRGAKSDVEKKAALYQTDDSANLDKDGQKPVFDPRKALDEPTVLLLGKGLDSGVDRVSRGLATAPGSEGKIFADGGAACAVSVDGLAVVVACQVNTETEKYVFTAARARKGVIVRFPSIRDKAKLTSTLRFSLNLQGEVDSLELARYARHAALLVARMLLTPAEANASGLVDTVDRAELIDKLNDVIRTSESEVMAGRVKGIRAARATAAT